MASACTHPIIYHGLCAACGMDVSSLPVSPAASGGSHAIVLGGAHKTIHLSSAALSERTRANTLTLLNERKMICVLDLDHTLLHATSDARVASHLGREPDLHRFTLGAPPFGPRTHYVRLRPGLQTFLEEVSALFDLHVYTMGARAYADAVVPILDPTHRFIKHRVVSRDESTTAVGVAGNANAVNPAHVAKSLKRMYPCDEGLICIVDDRCDVWSTNAKNVVRAFEYLYFSGRGEMNSRPGEQHQSSDAAASLPIFPYQLATHPFPDNVLVSLTRVLQATHKLFYDQIDAATQPPPGATNAKPAPVSDLYPLSAQLSVPRLLAMMKQTTLAGCVIVFSGVFPTLKAKDGTPSNSRNGSGAQKAEAWIQATAYGAICLEDFPEREPVVAAAVEEDAPVVPFGVDALAKKVPPRVTHVVAARDGSAKIHYANTLSAEERPILVHVSWLWHSIAHFQKGDEQLFPLWSDKAKQANSQLNTNPNGDINETGANANKDATRTDANTVGSTPAASVVPSAAASTAPEAASAAAAPVSPPAPLSAPAVSAAPVIGGIRRRIPKKAAPTVVAPPPEAAMTAAAASSSASTSATSSSAAASAVSSSDRSRFALHLVHHVSNPISVASLVSRVRARIAADESAGLARQALADLTVARELVKAQQLTAAFRTRSSPNTPKSGRRKSVSWSAHELGPTNPMYDLEPHTIVDAAAVNTMSAGAPEESAALKRKAQLPLDDIDRLRKERKVGRSSRASRAASVTDVNDDDVDVDMDDVLDLTSDEEDGTHVSTEELYRQPDVATGTGDASAAADADAEADPFDISDDLFDQNDAQDYGDADQFDDDN